MRDASACFSGDRKKAAVLLRLAAKKGYLPAYMLLAQLASAANDEHLVIEALCALLAEEDASKQLLPDLLSQCAVQLAATLRDPRHAEAAKAHAKELKEIARFFPVIHAVNLPRQGSGDSPWPRPGGSAGATCASGVATAHLPAANARSASVGQGQDSSGPRAAHAQPCLGRWQEDGDVWRFSADLPSLASLAEGHLDISEREVRLSGPAGNMLVREAMPQDADAARAQAQWSKKHRRLSLIVPRCSPPVTARASTPVAAERSAPGLDGRWVTEDGTFVASIQGSRLAWAEGSPVHLERLRGGEVSIQTDGETFHAKLDDRGRLLWSDGDTWIREAGAPPRASASPAPSPAPAPEASPAPAAARLRQASGSPVAQGHRVPPPSPGTIDEMD